MVAAILHQVHDMFEAIDMTIIGVWNFLVIVMSKVLTEGYDFVALFLVLTEGEQVFLVGFVHGEDEVEAIEVFVAKGSRASIKGYTTLRCCC